MFAALFMFNLCAIHFWLTIVRLLSTFAKAARRKSSRTGLRMSNSLSPSSSNFPSQQSLRLRFSILRFVLPTGDSITGTGCGAICSVGVTVEGERRLARTA